jgi:hypothetical protein
LIQLVENGMPLPHEKGGKKGDEQCHRLFAAGKSRGGREDYREIYVLCKKGNMWE